MGSAVKKVLLPEAIFGGKKKAAPAAPAAPVKGPEGPKGPSVDDRKRGARAGLLGRGAEDRELNVNVRESLGANADRLGVPSSAEIQGNRRFKRQGTKGASRRLLS